MSQDELQAFADGIVAQNAQETTAEITASIPEPPSDKAQHMAEMGLSAGDGEYATTMVNQDSLNGVTTGFNPLEAQESSSAPQTPAAGGIIINGGGRGGATPNEMTANEMRQAGFAPNEVDILVAQRQPQEPVNLQTAGTHVPTGGAGVTIVHNGTSSEMKVGNNSTPTECFNVQACNVEPLLDPAQVAAIRDEKDVTLTADVNNDRAPDYNSLQPSMSGMS